MKLIEPIIKTNIKDHFGNPININEENNIEIEYEYVRSILFRIKNKNDDSDIIYKFIKLLLNNGANINETIIFHIIYCADLKLITFMIDDGLQINNINETKILKIVCPTNKIYKEHHNIYGKNNIFDPNIMNYLIRLTNNYVYHLSKDPQIKDLNYNISCVYVSICEYLIRCDIS